MLDTNILVSAMLNGDGPPGRVLAAVKAGDVTLITSTAQLRELKAVLRREHLSRYIRREEAEDLMRNLEAVGEVVTTDLPHVNDSPDQADNLILGTAIAGRADMIISGDKKHMLSLSQVNGIQIVTATDATKLLGLSSPK